MKESVNLYEKIDVYTGKQKLKERRDFLFTFFWIAVIVVVFCFMIGFVPVKGASMQPGINPTDGQSVVAIMRTRNFTRGTVAVFKNPDSPDKNLIKRIIAVPGDAVRIYRDENLAKIEVNGQPLEEKYIKEEMYWTYWGSTPMSKIYLYEKYGSGDEIVFTVPKDKFFALGDNRNISRDSRYYGLFDRSLMLGTAFLLFDERGVGAL